MGYWVEFSVINSEWKYKLEFTQIIDNSAMKLMYGPLILSHKALNRISYQSCKNGAFE